MVYSQYFLKATRLFLDLYMTPIASPFIRCYSVYTVIYSSAAILKNPVLWF